MADATEPLVGRSVGHDRAVFVATSGHFCWPPMGTSYWPLTKARRIILLDEENPVDSFYVKTDLAAAYDDLEIHNVPNAGHYVPRALLLSGALKAVVADFLADSAIQYTLDQAELVKWHETRFYSSLDKRRLGHAAEHLEVLLRNQAPARIREHVRTLNAVANSA